MKKTFKISGLDCANCAEKLERNLSKIKGIDDVTINFMTEKLFYEVESDKETLIYEEVVKKIKKQDKKIEITEVI